YYYSNWGATGFCRSKPELNVKPAFVAFATLTRVLDGARFVGALPLGSPSLYGLEFDLPDGQKALALWTLRGRRPVTLRLSPGDGWRQIDDQANETALKASDKRVSVTLTPSPLYLVGKGTVEGAEAEAPQYDDKPEGKYTEVANLGRQEEWAVEPGRSP